MVAEDDVDMESLQAQIDMSMSFAHNLVMSWIKPAQLAQLRPSVNASQVLEEELRRPPRLGVGASIPTAPLARVASKLKRRLGKNGADNEDGSRSQPQGSSVPDNEEHKGRPAKRKTRVDPFGQEGSKKKRRADSDANRYPFVDSPSPLENSALGEPLKHDSFSGKVKQRMGPGGQRSATLVSSPPVRSPIQTTFSSSPTAPPSEPSPEIHAPRPGKTPASSRVHTNSMPIPDKTKPLGIPLLNLDGPLEPADQPGNTNELNNPRRKRKRRKRKKTKTRLGAGTEDSLG